MKKTAFGLFFVVSFAVSGCLTTYRDFPVAKVQAKPPESKSGSIRYTVKRFDILEFGGYDTLRKEFAKNSPFATTEEVQDPPTAGPYVVVTTKWKLPSTPALIFGYISAATLTIVPAWSTQDGYMVAFDVYRDGKKEKTYTYEVTRKFGAWIFLLPFIWANLATYDESQAFHAIASQFFEDSRDAIPRAP